MTELSVINMNSPYSNRTFPQLNEPDSSMWDEKLDSYITQNIAEGKIQIERHSRAELNARRINNLITAAGLLFTPSSGVLSAAESYIADMAWLGIVAAGCAAIASSFLIIQKITNFQEKAIKHDRCARDWKSFVTELEQQLALPISNRREINSLLNWIKEVQTKLAFSPPL